MFRKALFLSLLMTSCGQKTQTVASTRSATEDAETLVWNCQALSDPDFVSADLWRGPLGLVAHVYQESGDGDEGGDEFVPVSETRTDGKYIYRQISTAKSPKGDRGKTTGLYLELDLQGSEDWRLDAGGFLTAKSGPTGAPADETNEVTCSNYNPFKVFKDVDLSDFKDTKVDMGAKIIALVDIPYKGSKPTVTWENGGQCVDVRVWGMSQQGAKKLRVRIEPEFNADDGINSCRVVIKEPDGAVANLELFRDYRD